MKKNATVIQNSGKANTGTGAGGRVKIDKNQREFASRRGTIWRMLWRRPPLRKSHD